MEEIIIIIALILFNGIFAMSEIAVISARKSSLQTDANKGSSAAQKALRLQGNPDRFLSSVQIGITLIGLLTGMVSGNKVAVLLGETLASWGLDHTLAFGIAQTIIIIIVTYLSIVFGELVPKRIGMSAAEKVAKVMAGPLEFLSYLSKPVVWALSASTSGIVALLGIKDQESKVTEEEIKSIIQEGADDGEVLPVEQDIVERVFTLGDLSVDNIMTHRSDLVWLEKNMTGAQVKCIVEQDIFGIYPVVDRDMDNVIGIMLLKDFVANSSKPNFRLSDIITQPLYFHETMNVYKVLEEMKAKKTNRALVCDEFGKCCGIITHKDILEALIGDMNDDTDEEPDIKERADGDGWIVDGQCTIYDFQNHFDLDEDLQDYESTTIAGLILETLQHVPEEGESIEWCNLSFEVATMDGPRIDKVFVRRIEEDGEEDD